MNPPSNPFDKARTLASPEAKASLDLIEGFFAALEAMDCAAVARYFSEHGLHRDEPTHSADAVGPAAIELKFSNAISGLDRFVMGVDTVVGDAERVMTRRTEEWHFPTGEIGLLPVTCVHEIRGGKIFRCHEFWDMTSLMEQMPQSWMDTMMKRASGN